MNSLRPSLEKILSDAVIFLEIGQRDREIQICSACSKNLAKISPPALDSNLRLIPGAFVRWLSIVRGFSSATGLFPCFCTKRPGARCRGSVVRSKSGCAVEREQTHPVLREKLRVSVCFQSFWVFPMFSQKSWVNLPASNQRRQW